MIRLYVLYDARCGLCRGARSWLEKQTQLIELVFIAAGTDRAARMFPALPRPDVPEDLVVVSDEGCVYRGGSAWIMCLYALEEYREWSATLASPNLLPYARRAFDLVSRKRSWLSAFLGMQSEAEIAATLRRVREPACSLPVAGTAR